MNFTFIFIGIFISLAIYHLIIFIGRKHDLSHLSFTFFCLLYCSGLFWNSIYRELETFNSYIFDIGYTFTCILFAINFIFFANTIFYSQHLYKFSIILATCILIVTAGNTGAYILLKQIIFIHIIYIIFSLSLIMLTGIILFTLIFKKRVMNKKEKIIFFGFIILSCYLLIYTFFYALSIKFYGPITRIFFLCMAIAFSYALADSFNQEHKDLLQLKENLERKVRERTKQLVIANKQKEQFFINIAHEIKTPLTVVCNSFNEYMKKNKDSYEFRQMRIGLDKLKKDVINFLDTHKLKSGQVFYNHDQIIEITNIIENTVNLFKQVAVKQNISITYNIDEKPVYISIDPIAFDRILNNLLENAIKYNKVSGNIHLDVSISAKNIILKVSDTGIGIPQNILKYIFQPYYQISHEKQNIQGLGMGLAIVKNILDTINASISVESTFGAGSVFCITFHRYYVEQQDTVSTLKNILQPSISNTNSIILEDLQLNPTWPTILIVEDNLELLSFLIKVLRTDYNIYYARDGSEALKKISVIENLDIIISDIMMDGMDGYTFRKKLVKDGRFDAIPFVFLTARSSFDSKLRGLDIGAVDYIVKPFEIDELKAKIKSLINLRRASSPEGIKSIREQINDYLTAKELQNNKGLSTESFKGVRISDQELRVITLLKEGLIYKEIAYKLNVSLNTVRTYISRIYKKLDIHSSQELFTILDYN